MIAFKQGNIYYKTELAMVNKIFVEWKFLAIIIVYYILYACFLTQSLM